MNLANKLFDTKTKLLILFLIGVIILLLLINFNRQKQTNQTTPSPAPVIYSITLPKILPLPSFVPKENLSTQTAKFSFTFDKTSFPKEIKAYGVLKYGIDPQVAQNIANSFSFSSQPVTLDSTSNNKLFWQSGDKTRDLIISLDNGFIGYSYNYTPGKPDIGGESAPEVRSATDAIESAISFLEKRQLMRPDLNTKEDQVVLFSSSGDEPVVVNDFKQAGLFQVNFVRSVDNNPTFMQYGNSFPVSVWVDKSKQVIKLEYRYPLIQSDNQTYTILDIEDAKRKIVNNEGIIVRYGEDNEDLPKSTSLSTVTLSEVNLSYLDDRDNKLFQPIFVFKGTALELGSNQQKDIVIYLPAIK